MIFTDRDILDGYTDFYFIDPMMIDICHIIGIINSWLKEFNSNDNEEYGFEYYSDCDVYIVTKTYYGIKTDVYVTCELKNAHMYVYATKDALELHGMCLNGTFQYLTDKEIDF